MADVNIASLNFKLGIPNEQEFNDSIKAIIDTAQKMNTEVSNLLGNLNKVSSGRSMSQSKKNEMLLGLRNQLKEAEADVSRLESKLASFQNHAQHYGTSPYLKETSKNAIKQVVADLEAAKQKVTQLQEAYKKLGGDKALASTFKQTKKDVQDTSIELLQMREYYKQIAANANSSATAQKKLTEETRRGSRELSGMSRMWREIKNYTMLYFSFEGARRLVSSLVQVSAEFEKQRVSLRAILQDADGAEKIFSQIKELAVQSPFQFKELVTYTKQLSAFSIPMNELYDTTKMLADVSAGLGVGMDRLVLAYGQIRSASFLRGQEVRQLTEAGIPILEELRKQFVEMGEIGITAGEVFDKISSRQVTFEMVQKVFKDMTSEGGKFYQMQEVLAETLSGRLSNLTDAYQIMFSEIGEKMDGFLKGSVDAVRSLAENYEQVGRILLELVAIYGTYKTALTIVRIAEEAAAQAQIALTLGNTLSKAQATGKAIEVLTGKMGIFAKVGSVISKINPYAAAAAGAATLLAIIYNLSKAQTKEQQLQSEINGTLENYNKKVEEETSMIGYLLGRMEKLDSTTKEYKTVKNELLNNYGQYLDDVQKEALDVGNLAGMYDTLAESIRNAQREKTMSEGFSAINKYYTDEYGDAIDKLKEDLKALNISTTGSVYQQLAAYFRDELKRGDFTADAAKAYSDMLTKSMNNTTRIIGHQFSNPEDLKKQVSSAANVLKTESEALADSLNMIYEAAKPPVAEDLKDWQQNIKDIADEAHRAQVELGINVTRQSSLSNVVSDVKEKIEESKSALLLYEGIEDDLADKERTRLKYLEDINKVLLGKATATTSGVSSGTLFKDNIDGVEAQIKVYQKLKSAYSDLIEYIDDSRAREFLATMFPEDMAYANYDMEIRRLATSLLDMGEAGAKAAMSYDELFRDDKLAAYIAKLKQANDAAEEYDKMMEIWEKFVPDKEGIDKIVDDYTKTIEEIDKAKTDALETLYAREGARMDGMAFGPEFYAELQRINDEYFKAVTSALNKANKDLKSGAQEWVESWLKMKTGMDFSNISDLTVRQLGRLEDALEELSKNPAVIFEGMEDKLKAAKINIDDLVAAIKASMQSIKQNVDDNQWDDVIRKTKMYRRVIDLATTSIKKLGEATGNPAFEKFADDMDRTVKTVTTIFESIAQDDVFGATIAALTLVTDAWVEAVSATIEYKRAVSQLESEFLAMKYAADLSKGVDTIFGKNTYQSLLNARNLISQLNGNMIDLEASLNKITVSTKNAKWWQFLIAPTAPAAWFSLFTNKSYSVMELLEQSGASLKDELGRINVEALEAVRDGFENMSQAEKDALDAAIRDAKAYNDALDQLNEAMGDLVGGIADDFADTIIDQWKEAGDAAADYGEILDDIASQYAKMYIRDTIMGLFDTEDFKKKLEQLTIEKDAAGVLGLFDEKIKELEEYYPFFEDVLDSLSGYFTEDKATQSNTLGGGIKSITEDTANLLASYVNAIRADVAAIRQAVVAGNTANVPAPTLAEYLTQIQANTYNTAQNTANLLADLRSMMTVTDGPALRVFI